MQPVFVKDNKSGLSGIWTDNVVLNQEFKDGDGPEIKYTVDVMAVVVLSDGKNVLRKLKDLNSDYTHLSRMTDLILA